MLLVAHLQFARANAQTKNCKRATKPTHRDTDTVDRQARPKKTTPYNSGFKKLAVQGLNKVLCFVSSSVLADSFVLRNRQLLKPAKRYTSF